MNTKEASNYWLDIEVKRLDEALPAGEIVVSSGISPSASYHIGHYPEVLMAEALAWGLRRLGREVRHLHVVDNMDPLRKRYDFLPEEYDRYVGWPICLVPNPYGEGSYSDHFFEQFRQYFDVMGIKPDEIVRSYEDLYQSGKMATQIEKVLDKLDEVREIFAEFGRNLEDDWTPVQVIAEDNKFINATPSSWDRQSQTIEGVDYTKGGAKLNWRLDWPARWQVLNVAVEPFNDQEHGASSGSYDTGKAFSERIFDYPAPMPGARYGNIHLGDDTKKMSSSKGNLIKVEEALKVVPPSVLRYFVIRSKPPKNLRFDPGSKLPNLIDEYKQVAEEVRAGLEPEFADAYRFADIGDALTTVPFTHLANAYQAGLRRAESTKEILERTGYDVDMTALENELTYVDNWLENYAPEAVKFDLAEQLPEVDLAEPQKAFLKDLATEITTQDKLEAEWVHETVYGLKDKHGLRPADAFKAIYKVLLDQDHGPKAGWYLTTIDKDWLVKRLRLEA